MATPNLTARHQQLLADADIGLRQSRRVIGAVAAHCDKPPLSLLRPNELQLSCRRRLRQKIIDSRFSGDCGGGQRVIIRDHHRSDPHGT
jgi:hypothetical protein